MQEHVFSASALRRAWDARLRRGDNTQYLFPELKPINAQLREARIKRRDELKEYAEDGPDRAEVKVRHGEIIGALRDEYDQVLTAALEQTSLAVQRRIETGDFKLTLDTKPPLSSDKKMRPLYALLDRSPAGYFISRQVEYELQKLVQRTSNDRNIITQQLAIALERPSNKTIVRSDIANFYESIDHDRVRQLLRDKHHISRTAFTYVDQLLNSYSSTTGVNRGIPRGMAISARIAEVYMAEIDREISAGDVLMYLRYVDDIVIVASQRSNLPTADQRLDALKATVKTHGLSLNRIKTHAISTPRRENFRRAINFLGYEYSITEGGVSIDMSQERLERYKRRIDLTFEAYAQQPNDRSYLMLEERMRFLTSNTRLRNNRRQALVGIYFSNSSIPEVSSRIRALDRYTAHKISSTLSKPCQKKSMERFSFAAGFENKVFYSFSPKRVSRIVRPWKYVS